MEGRTWHFSSLGCPSPSLHPKTASQTTFSGVDAGGDTLAYDSGYIDVYLNGVHLDPSDYTASSGSSIVLDVGAAVNDELYVVGFGTFNVAAVAGSAITSGTNCIT